jgi:hypothetical protein
MEPGIIYRLVGGNHDGEYVTLPDDRLRYGIRLLEKQDDQDLWRRPRIETYDVTRDALLLPVAVFSSVHDR